MYQSDPQVSSTTSTARLERVSRAYALSSVWYTLRGMFLVSAVYRSSILSQIRFFSGNLRDRHLEVPVGNGSLTSSVLSYRRWKKQPTPTQFTGIDCSETMIEHARSRFAKSDTIDVRLGDVANLEFPDSRFDSINVANGFHCFPDPAAALDELTRVLAPQGTMAINALLFPRGNALAKWISQSINTSAQKSGALNAPFQEDDVREMLRSRRLQIIEDRIEGNTLYIRAQKSN